MTPPYAAKCSKVDSNHWPQGFQPCALPTELLEPFKIERQRFVGLLNHVRNRKITLSIRSKGKTFGKVHYYLRIEALNFEYLFYPQI